MTLPSRHMIRNSRGLRPSTLHLGHRGSTQYWVGKKHFRFFQTAEAGKRTPDSSVKGSGANHCRRAPALVSKQAQGIGTNLHLTHSLLRWPHYSRVASSRTLHFGNPKVFLLFWYAEIVYFKNPLGAICGRLSILHNLKKCKMAAGYYYHFIFLLLFVIEQHIIPHFRVWNTW